MLYYRLLPSTSTRRPVSPWPAPPAAESPEPGTQALGLDVIGLLLGDICRIPLPVIVLLKC